MTPRDFLHWLGMVGGILYLLVSAARMLIYFLGGPTTFEEFTRRELDDIDRKHGNGI